MVGDMNLGRLELLADDERLGVGSCERLVVGREREKDDETGEDCETRREHAEDAGRAVAVREEAALGRSPPCTSTPHVRGR
jgi:hypothetical protein